MAFDPTKKGFDDKREPNEQKNDSDWTAEE